MYILEINVRGYPYELNVTLITNYITQ